MKKAFLATWMILVFLALAAVSCKKKSSTPTASGPAGPTPTIHLVFQFGGAGAGNGLMNNPADVAFDNSGNIYVADYGNDLVQKFNPMATPVTQWGNSGGVSQINNPYAVGLDTAGNVYATDFSTDKVIKTTDNGNYLGTLVFPPAMDGPNGLLMLSGGGFWVTNWMSNEIILVDASGNTVDSFGGPGTGPGLFTSSIGIGRDQLSNLYVADYGGDRVQKFDSNGNFITQWGTTGTGNGEFNSPWDVAVAADGKVFVSDFSNARVQVFDSAGAYQAQFNSVGGVTLTGPSGLAFDPMGRLFIADWNGNVVLKCAF